MSPRRRETFFFGDFMSSSGLLLPSPPPCSDAVVQSLAEHFEATLATTAAAVSVSCKGPPWKLGNVEGRWLGNANHLEQSRIQQPTPRFNIPLPIFKHLFQLLHVNWKGDDSTTI